MKNLAIIMQICPEDVKDYSSKKTTKCERRYTSYEMEVLAIICVKKFRKYLLGIPFKILTDCAAFKMTLPKKDLITRVARCALLLQEFDCTVEHLRGSRMRHIDALSRNLQFVRSLTRQMPDQVKIAQESDDGLKAIIEILKAGSYSDYVVDSGLLYKNPQKLLVIPKAVKLEIIRKIHGIGYFGKIKMID